MTLIVSTPLRTSETPLRSPVPRNSHNNDVLIYRLLSTLERHYWHLHGTILVEAVNKFAGTDDMALPDRFSQM